MNTRSSPAPGHLRAWHVAGIGQALLENPDFPYTLVRNEQAAVHMAAGYAKASNRLKPSFARRPSTRRHEHDHGAALATINRLPVLLLLATSSRGVTCAGSSATRIPSTQDTGVNDCFKPVSRYWDRIYRPEQIITALLR